VILKLCKPGEPDADVVREWRTCMGATDCSTGLRHKYGTVPPLNALHGSDSSAFAAREMNYSTCNW